MKAGIILIIAAALITASCRKRDYPQEHEKLKKEDIFLDATIDNEPLSLTVGTDDYYCYTSCTRSADSIYAFAGELKKYDCNPCPRSLRVELSDYRTRLAGASVAVDSAFRAGRREFLPPVTRPNAFRFVAHSNKGIASVSWKFSDGTTSHDTVALAEFRQSGPQTMSLTVRTPANCENTVINKIYVDANGGYLACSINAVSAQNNEAVFSPQIMGGRPPFRYSWNFGDGSSTIDSVHAHQYKWPGGYPVKLIVKDADGHVCESNYNYVTNNDPSSCAVNMSVFHTGARNLIPNTAKIQWRDNSNVVFSSDMVAQPADSYFELVKSEEYVRNKSGDPTRLLTVRINVWLSDGSRSIRLKSENAIIAVAYK